MGIFKTFFGSSSMAEPVDFSAFITDMHSHLIPNIDDGVQSVDESLDMIRGLHDLGFSKLITTPHIMNDLYQNDRENILKGLDKVKEAVEKAGIPIELEAAAEYLLDDGFQEKLKNNDLLTIGNGYVLVEMSYVMEPINLKHLIFDIQIAGYKVILAHAERYLYWYGKKEPYYQLMDRSVYLQLNLLSLAGYYGNDVKKNAQWLLENNMYQFIGTDLHNQSYLAALQDSQYQPLVKKLIDKSEQFLNNQL
ncbi:MAG: tyrosine-protein phosphatase [Bacteroidales bacterium]